MAQRILIASSRKEAGKTSIIIGLAKALMKEKSIAYFKPLGNRVKYKKKKIWDFDSELITTVLGISNPPEELTLGFDYSKLRLVFNEDELVQKLKEMADQIEADKDILLIEGSENLVAGSSLSMDPVNLSKLLAAEILLIVNGSIPNDAVDDIANFSKVVARENINVKGIIITQIQNIENFKTSYIALIDKFGFPILGLIPRDETLTQYSIEYLVETISGKVLAGEEGLDKLVEHTLVGAMSAAQVVDRPVWTLKNKLVITPGDRSDMIMAALESSTAGIVLTNNIIPPDQIILSKANLKKIPLILVPHDTFTTAKMIDDMEVLFTKNENLKVELLEKLIKENVDLSKF
ncbi:MAG: phosphotransacetylase family protein [Candidatus Heimdallarchaeota archaeon]|nr:phosphotransacetylase family protein [Candidatus Heimdallarchaeota archaeon]